MTGERIGLPYARPTFAEAGRYGVICPECNAVCLGAGDGEDPITKSALAAYARHFEEAHRG